MESLNKTIQAIKEQLDNPNLAAESRKIREDFLHYLERQKNLLAIQNEEMMLGKKYCWRYMQYMIKGCSVCEDCLTADQLVENEGEEV